MLALTLCALARIFRRDGGAPCVFKAAFFDLAQLGLALSRDFTALAFEPGLLGFPARCALRNAG